MSKRKLIYCPEIQPETFLLFFERGKGGRSWSLRDYSQPGRVSVQYAAEFEWTAEELLRRSSRCVNAPVVSTERTDYWHDSIQALNRAHLRGEDDNAVQAAGYPILFEQEFLELRKATKPQDVARMRESPNSEDWVTWHLLQLMRRRRPDDWWALLEDAAARQNPKARVGMRKSHLPRLAYWRAVASPGAYEKESRRRMETSTDPAEVSRARIARPVEGMSEIDVVVETNRHLVFAEAKLGSDVSGGTKHDPARDQIVRNIDCLLESTGEREPVFWMLVKDHGPERNYMRLTAEYRDSVHALPGALPHRRVEVLRRVSERMAVIRWIDLAAGWIEDVDPDPAVERVRQELLRRIRC